MSFLLLVTVSALIVGGILSLVFGRRPAFKVYTTRLNRDFGTPESYERPPMRDVTPRPQQQIES